MEQIVFQTTNGDVHVTWTKTDSITPHAKRLGYKYVVLTSYVNTKTGQQTNGRFYTKK